MTINPDECTLLQNTIYLSAEQNARQFLVSSKRRSLELFEEVRSTGSNFRGLKPAVHCLILAALISLSAPSLAADGHGRLLIAMTDEVRNMCTQAEQLINSGKAKEAINLLHRAQSMDPSCGEVHGYLGMAFQNSGNPQQAIPEYMKALELNPQMTFINVNLGSCLMNMNQMDKAVPYFQHYLETNPNAPDAAQVRGYIQQAGSRKGQSNLRSLIEQGQSQLNAKRFSEAQASFQQALSVDPNFAPAHFYLGFTLAQSGQLPQAIAEFQQTVKIDPSIKEAILNIGSNYQSLGDIPNAIGWYQRYLKENPGSPKAGEIHQRIQGLQQQMKQAGAQGGGGNAYQPPPQGGGFVGTNQSPPGGADDYMSGAASGGKYFRWSRMPIRVFISSGTGVPGYQNSFHADLMYAFSQWALGSEGRIAFSLSTDISQSDIVCDWTGDPKRILEQGRPIEGGLTKLNGQPLPNGVDVGIVGAKVTILTNRGGTPLNDEDMKKVCLHEVGHALGINGHSNSNTDVMFFSESPTILPVLSVRDRATICRLYGNYPQMPISN
ncbi:MAG: tetratricopeptide repeat protein [Candidatus Melainabacteria bacterium]|nr:tetratricopeptide repeat protein [Candidatus Melainabacteria bacterium]